MDVVQVEKSLNGELDIKLSMEEGELLYSFIKFFTRDKLESVTFEEHDVAEKLSNEIKLFLEDDLPIDEDRIVVEALLAYYKLDN